MSKKHLNNEQPVSKIGGISLNSKRKFLKGVAVAPVFLTVASRPVFARNCSVSGAISGNLSDPGKIFTCDGRTPGYWGQHPGDWEPLGYDSGSCRKGYSGMHCKHNAYNNDGTPFHGGKGFSGSIYDNLSMMRVIHLGGGTPHKTSHKDDDKYEYRDRYQLGAHAVASLLNAAYFGADVFGYNEDQIRQLWKQKHMTDPERLKQFYQMLNENRRDMADSLGFDGFVPW